MKKECEVYCEERVRSVLKRKSEKCIVKKECEVYCEERV